MAHTIEKQIYCEEEHKYVTCEIMVLDEEESLPGTDRREIVLYCTSCGTPFNELSDTFTADIEGLYPETELIDQYEDFDDRQGD
ncbi:MAG: hypothetical protein ACD_20C00328G0013 [uncultured bacterium]|nr:MAG: hypothetical protein ACD_20C00328G0013 [uncultured bacterium]HBH18025.1 hypothetical protein [Cyanobacteria bacterium UBA9579]